MTAKRAGVLALLLAGLLGVQHFGLEPLPETQKENKLKKLPSVSAGDMLPTYVASLFFGAFRAVAIDVLWIQLKRAEEERRWYERREILKMISYVQPRNPEVWSHLGWHSAYNVANGFTAGKKQWEWIRFGLTWLRQGARMLPENPHIKFELAFTLMHKPSWIESKLDLGLLQKIEGDEDLQRDLLPDDVAPGGAPRSAFALARLWLERARQDIEKLGDRPHKTQMGLYIYPSTMDGYIRRTLYLEGIRAWQEGRTEAAVERFREAEAHVRWMLDKKYVGNLSSLFNDWADFYRDLPPVVELHSRARKSGAREDDLAALKALQTLVLKSERMVDEGFLWSRTEPGALLNGLKRRLAPADAWECNDGLLVYAELPEGTSARANIAPAGLDEDWYGMTVEAPKDGQGPTLPLRLTLSFARPAGASMDFKVSVFDTRRRFLQAAEVKGTSKLQISGEAYGTYFVKVEPLDPKAPPPPDTRYFLQWSASE